MVACLILLWHYFTELCRAVQDEMTSDGNRESEDTTVAWFGARQMCQLLNLDRNRRILRPQLPAALRQQEFPACALSRQAREEHLLVSMLLSPVTLVSKQKSESESELAG